MPQIFHPAMNSLARGTIFGGVFILAGVAWAGGLWVRSNYVTDVDVVRDQPVPFSHDHHVSGLGLDCRYCHATVETSPFAGMPATEVCMGCHAVVWKDSPLLAPVRESARTGQPLRWNRVHDLPDFVYFNHSIHVARGVGCESCHGRVDQMPLMRKNIALHMEWCLDCHRHPESGVRNRSDVFAFGLGDRSPALPISRDKKRERLLPERIDDGRRLVKEYGIAAGQITDCVVCHR
jgi:hypothetical protein